MFFLLILTTHIYNHAFGNSILCSKLFIDVFNFSKKNYSLILIQFCYLIIICSFIKKNKLHEAHIKNLEILIGVAICSTRNYYKCQIPEYCDS